VSYQVLARKHRPQQFDDVIAQEHVTRTLKNALKSSRVSSGYLFTGPRGTGKTTTARILAKAMNCTEGPTATPCDKCASCTEIIAGSSLDVLEIDAASNTGVDDIRTLRENVRYLPTSGKKRIYIIDEVHRLSGSAFDALLKTLEEPPAHVAFIFATTEPHKVPPTIRSRTQRYDFHRVSVSDLSAHIKKISGLEGITIEDDALYLLARKADGSVRDAISLLDQLFAYAGENITSEIVIEALGLIDNRFYFDYIEAIAARDCAAGLEKTKELIDSGVEIPEFCAGLAQHFRNLLILQSLENPEKILELSESELEAYSKQKKYFSQGDLLRMIKFVSNMTLDLKSGLDPRLLLETNTIKLASMESTVLFEDILAHLSEDDEVDDNNQDRDLFGKSSTVSGPKAKISTEPASERKTAEETSASSRAVNLPIVQTGWPKFIEHLKGENPMLAALLAMAEIIDVTDNVITARFFNSGGTTKQVVEKPNHQAVILANLRDYFKTNLKIQYEVVLDHKKEETAKPVSAPEKIDTEKILREDHKLKNIVEHFDGEIVGKKKIED